MKDGKRNLVVTIDEDLHYKFKVHCTKKKISIKDMIVKLLLEEIEKEKE